MGRKFACIHIKTANGDKIKKALYEYNQNDKKRNEEHLSLLKGIHKGIHNSLVKMFQNNFGEYIICHFAQHWYTILNSNLGWESVDNVSLKLSKYIDEPILSIGYFDNDVFTMAIIQNSKIRTKHISGFGLDVYGLKAKKGNVDIFSKYLEIEEKADAIDEVLNIHIEDFAELYDKLEKLYEMTGIPFEIGYEDYENFDEEHKNLCEVIDFSVEST